MMNRDSYPTSSEVETRASLNSTSSLNESNTEIDYLVLVLTLFIYIRGIDSIRQHNVSDIFHEHRARVDGSAIMFRRLRREGRFPWPSAGGVPSTLELSLADGTASY